ncbi:hypothetical protein GWI33_008953 [Rhynchophorus ferrugineus]|uniref:HORMA domain-containing protein n=1 Tax=Rhynchophorus ferrugineus TaxID=354439 RepID=A0A834IC87_RHYFE|nr:hypothetical protein GWI33_008953 [Rhynchophorus ferrugineus]
MSTKTEISAALTNLQVQNSTKTFNLSKQFAKRLLRIGTLNILYRRLDIPEEEFTQANFAGTPYMLFKRKSTNTFIKYFHSVSMGIIDALEKDYLKELYLYILKKDTKELQEKYNFKVKYNKDNEKSTDKSSDVKVATIEFLKAIANLSPKKFSSNDTEISVEFLFNDDVPKDYQPPNFENAKNPLYFDAEVQRVINLCDINTGFHKIKCYGSGLVFNDSKPNSVVSSRTDLHMDSDDIETVENQTEKSNADLSEARTVDEDNISIISTDINLTCPCVWDLDDVYQTTKCPRCFGFVHLACHGYLSAEDVDQQTFLCFHCTHRIDDEDYENLKLLMKLRIILFGIYTKRQFPIELLELGSMEERKFILSRLEILKIVGNDSFSDINYENLKEAIAQTFNTQNSQFFQ